MVDFTKYKEDADRIAETIFQLDYKGDIKDRNSFDRAMDGYLENAFELRENDTFRNMVFNKFVNKHPDRIFDEDKFYRETERRPIQPKKIKREYSHLGRVGKKIVYLRKDYIQTSKGRRLVYRDRRGKIGKVGR